MVSQTFIKVKKLILSGELRVSSHGYDEIAEDHIFIRDILSSIENGKVVEDYPEFGKGPCVLVLQTDRDANPVHVVWGIPKDHDGPAVLITAYRPDPARWTDDYLRRNI